MATWLLLFDFDYNLFTAILLPRSTYFSYSFRHSGLAMLLPNARALRPFTTSLTTCSILFPLSVQGMSATSRMWLGTCRALSCFRIAFRTRDRTVSSRLEPFLILRKSSTLSSASPGRRWPHVIQSSTSGKLSITPYSSAAPNLIPVNVDLALAMRSDLAIAYLTYPLDSGPRRYGPT